MSLNNIKKNNNKAAQLNSPLFPVVGIGASAGGLEAFKKLLKAIPKTSGMAYVLVQHLDPTHQSMLSEILQKETQIPVVQISNDLVVEPDHIYIIPSNKMLVGKKNSLQLTPPPPHETSLQNGPNHPIDIFFNSLAEVYQSQAIGIVLSGTPTDGTHGLKAIKDRGGITIAQDEASAAFAGMPESAIQSGAVDFILPPENIPQKLMEISKIIVNNGKGEKILHLQDTDVYKEILYLLRVRKGTDFTYYKQNTIHRRIIRRLAITKKESIAGYLKFLKENIQEQDTLYHDLLIPVTSFFRDIESIQGLCDKVFPMIVKNRDSNESIRIWVAGCSTGEEVYSIAICLKEFLDDLPFKIQIFGTDLSEPAISKARAGIYKKNEMEGLSAKRLESYFSKVQGGYQANKSIRDLCVFAVHNFLKDPPFSKMDFISCRNVLIYMEPFLQKKALTTFHYALNPQGFLLLGKSETITATPDLFTFSGKNDKLFTRKDVPSKYTTNPQRNELTFDFMSTNNKVKKVHADFQKSADEIMLSKYSPAGVVVDEALDIVHFRGNTGSYLVPSPGKASFNILKMAKDNLAFELRSILHKAKKENVPVHKENIAIDVSGSQRFITVEVVPLQNMMEPHYLILFHDKLATPYQTFYIPKSKAGSKLKKGEKDLRLEQLERELAQGREDMRSITEEQEVANEELQSSNEELLSSSEELQSLNEELETSKEELQSTNEELTVVNQEMIGLNGQLTESKDYAEAIVAGIREPFLVLDKNLRIKKGNAAFYNLFRLNAAETEGTLIYKMGEGEWNIPQLQELLGNILPGNVSIKDFEIKNNFPHLGEKNLLLNASEMIIGKNEKQILLFIEDITEMVRENENRYRNLIYGLPIAVYTSDKDGYIQLYNDAAVALWGRKPQIGKDKWCGSWKIFKLDGSPLPLEDCPMAKTLKEGTAITGEEIIIERPDGERRHVIPFPQPVFDEERKLTGAVNTLIDITELKKSEREIKESGDRFHFIADSLPQKVWTADAVGNVNYLNEKWLASTGMPYEELKDWKWKKIVHPDDWEENEKKWKESIKTGNVFEIQHRFLNKDGVYEWHLSRGLPFLDEQGHVKMWIGTNTEINTVKEEEQRKSDFIKMASHELKTPVTSIKGYVQLLLMMLEAEQKTASNPQIKTSLSRIDKLINRLTRLITEMLDLSRVEMGKLDLKYETFDLNKLVEEAVADIRPTNSTHVININNEYYCNINGDKNRIEQVFINLLSNAIKYSANSDKIDVTVKKEGKDKAAIIIKDYGIGIDKDNHDKIFERFYRVDGKDEKTYPGFGIGLFIARAIIERHEGIITVQSAKGKGAAFTVVLPSIDKEVTGS